MDSRVVLNWHIRIMKVLGFWPAKHKSFAYTLWTIFLGIALFLSYPLFQGFCVFFVDTIDEAVVILLLAGTMTTTVMKVLVVRIKKKPFFKLLDLMGEMDGKVHFTEHKQFIEPILHDSNMVFITFVIICYLSWVACVVQTIFSPPEKRTYLSTYFYPIDFLHKPTIYVSGLVYEAISNAIFICVSQSVDLFGPALMHVLGGNIDILCHRLKNFGNEENDTKKLKLDLVENCKMFENITIYKELLEEVTAPGILIQFIVSGVVLCTCAFQLTTMDPVAQLDGFCFTLMYALAMLAEIFIPSYFGSFVSYKADKIADAIYHSNWIAMNVNINQMSRFMMLRMQEPMEISTAKVFTLNLITFLKILKTTYTLLAVLKSQA